MSENVKETLGIVFSQIMKTQAFVFSDIVEPEELDPEGKSLIKVSIHFKGPFSGTIEMVASEELCPVIASNVLGMEPDEEFVISHAHDTMKEMLNVTCGHLLTEVAGEGPVFELSPPALESATMGDWRATQAQADVVALDVEDEPVLLLYTLTEAEG